MKQKNSVPASGLFRALHRFFASAVSAPGSFFRQGAPIADTASLRLYLFPRAGPPCPSDKKISHEIKQLPSFSRGKTGFFLSERSVPVRHNIRRAVFLIILILYHILFSCQDGEPNSDGIFSVCNAINPRKRGLPRAA